MSNNILNTTIPDGFISNYNVDQLDVVKLLDFVKIMSSHRKRINYNTAGMYILDVQTFEGQLQLKQHSCSYDYNYYRQGYKRTNPITKTEINTTIPYDRVYQLVRDDNIQDSRFAKFKTMFDNKERRTYIQNTDAYVPSICSDLKVNGDHNEYTNKLYLERKYNVIAAMYLVFVDITDNCVIIEIPQHLVNAACNVFNIVNVTASSHYGCVSIGQLLIQTELVYHHDAHKLMTYHHEVDVPPELTHFFPTSKPTIEQMMTYFNGHVDPTAQRYLSDNVRKFYEDIGLKYPEPTSNINQTRLNAIKIVPLSESKDRDKLEAKREKLKRKLAALNGEIDALPSSGKSDKKSTTKPNYATSKTSTTA